MREAVTRARWMALTLLVICAEASSYPAPSGLPGPDGRPGLALQDGVLVPTVPTPSSFVVVPSIDGSSTRDRRRSRMPSLGTTGTAEGRLRDPTPPERLPEQDDDFLLGLRAAPANAPPLL